MTNWAENIKLADVFHNDDLADADRVWLGAVF